MYSEYSVRSIVGVLHTYGEIVELCFCTWIMSGNLPHARTALGLALMHHEMTTVAGRWSRVSHMVVQLMPQGGTDMHTYVHISRVGREPRRGQSGFLPTYNSHGTSIFIQQRGWRSISLSRLHCPAGAGLGFGLVDSQSVYCSYIVHRPQRRKSAVIDKQRS